MSNKLLSLVLTGVASTFFCSRFATVDEGLGRIDVASFRHQTLMEFLIESMDDTEQRIFRANDEEYLNIAEWPGVHCNADGEVIEVPWRWLFSANEGTINLHYLPPSIIALDIVDCDFTGQVDCVALPRSLKIIVLFRNKLTGTVDLTTLPSSTDILSFGSKNLTGSIDLRMLPASITRLLLDDNSFTGSITLSELPASLEMLCLSNNEFTGTIDLTRLPVPLECLMLANNALYGSLNFSALPDSLNELFMENNQFTGSVVLSLRHDQQINFSGNDLSQVVDTAGTPVDHPCVRV